MSKKPYSPMAPYEELKRVEFELDQAQTKEDLSKIVTKDGPKVGYKAFCYMLGGKMTPEAMKPDEACSYALHLEAQGNDDEAMAIYKKVLEAHADHAIAKSKVGA
ncbi:MAG TPA: hypothetical protein PKE64_28975 [Anaerolineae bacterium]|nr:hypothetical protein [Anaerolineae bacterium]HMR68064.1 hypothetical protein [Anaerolineae bacterium]